MHVHKVEISDLDDLHVGKNTGTVMHHKTGHCDFRFLGSVI